MLIALSARGVQSNSARRLFADRESLGGRFLRFAAGDGCAHALRQHLRYRNSFGEALCFGRCAVWVLQCASLLHEYVPLQFRHRRVMFGLIYSSLKSRSARILRRARQGMEGLWHWLPLRAR